MIIICRADAYATVDKRGALVRGNNLNIAKIMVASALALQNAGYEMNDTLEAFKNIKIPKPQTNSGGPA